MTSAIDSMTYVVLVLGVRYVLGASSLFSMHRIAIARALARHSRALAAFVYALITCPACLGFWVGAAFSGWCPLPGYASPFAAMLLNQAWAHLFAAVAADEADAVMSELSAQGSSDDEA